jgi:hypothetical protein
MQHGKGDSREHPVNGGEQIEKVECEWRRRKRGRRRQVPTSELLGSPLRRSPHPDGHLTDLLILEQPPHQLSPRVLPAVFLLAPGKQHLRLEPHEAAGHVQVVGGLVEAEIVDRLKKLIGDSGNRDIGDLQLLLSEEMEQQVERTRERVELDYEARSRSGRLCRSFGCGHD